MSNENNMAEVLLHLEQGRINARRYEFVRTMNPYTFAVINQRVLAGEDFDALVDAHIEGEARVRTKEGY